VQPSLWKKENICKHFCNFLQHTFGKRKTSANIFNFLPQTFGKRKTSATLFWKKENIRQHFCNFLQHTFGKRKTSANIFNFLQHTFGKRETSATLFWKKENIREHFQLSATLFWKKENIREHFQLSATHFWKKGNICNTFLEKGKHPQHFFGKRKTSANIFNFVQPSLGKKTKTSTTPPQFLERIPETRVGGTSSPRNVPRKFREHSEEFHPQHSQIKSIPKQAT
jgi:hypothetical protein